MLTYEAMQVIQTYALMMITIRYANNIGNKSAFYSFYFEVGPMSPSTHQGRVNGRGQ
jgi:hypothetical protein